MGRHVPPHRWADAASGGVPPAELVAMEDHAASCARCATARDRVRAAHAGFADIREGETPRLNWEHIGARIYWVTSSERRAGSRAEKPARQRMPWSAGGLAAGAALALGAWMLWPASSASEPAARAPVAPAQAVVPPENEPLEVELIRAPAAALHGVVTYRAGEVLVGGAELPFERVLGRGDVLSTGDDGRVTVQFGHASGFTLAPSSTLEVRALDEDSIALVLSGDVTVDIERRPARQRFEVVAGDHVVSVRGTSFEVGYRQGALAVACARGKVAVRGAGGELEIAAGQKLRLTAGESLAGRTPARLEAEAAAALERDVGVRLLPVWSGPQSASTASSVLELSARGNRAVTVDGEVVGAGSFEFRVMPGRHLIDAGHGPTWIRAESGATVDAAAARPKPPGKAVKVRRAHLERALGKGARARKCMRSLEKQGLLAGSFVEFDVGVNASGTLGHLNLHRTNVSATTAACVRSVVDGVRLPAGPKASLRYRIAF